MDQTLDADAKREAVMAEVRRAFKPEFLNRLDETLIFDPLSQDDLARIVDLQVEDMARRLASRRITLDVSEPAKGWLTRVGYDPAYGARPLRRTVQREIGDRLATLLLSGDVEDGDRVRVDVSEDLSGLTVTSGAVADLPSEEDVDRDW